MILRMELEAGSCVELFHSGGLRDGELAGYAIFFSGAWDAYECINAADVGGGRCFSGRSRPRKRQRQRFVGGSENDR